MLKTRVLLYNVGWWIHVCKGHVLMVLIQLCIKVTLCAAYVRKQWFDVLNEAFLYAFPVLPQWSKVFYLFIKVQQGDEICFTTPKSSDGLILGNVTECVAGRKE